ncbi:hypothetical protein NC651_036698 [Populus alba x Populus x berolinensis]|nr:hypothetical protein NC651_036698 [Populus alba x Populus x berolinensis]
MAETEIPNEPALPTKRKLDEDPFPENKQENHTNKSQKLESLTNNSPNTQEKTTDRTQTLEASFNNQNDTVQKVVEEEEDGDDEDGDYEDEENGEEVLVDRKGKGILIEEDEDDDSSDDDGDESSELDGGDDSEEAEEDDPLAEVDLDNILPSRTRRKAVHPGVYIANDNHVNDDDDDDDDSDAQVGDVIIEGVCLQNVVKLSSLRKYVTKCCPLLTNVQVRNPALGLGNEWENMSKLFMRLWSPEILLLSQLNGICIPIPRTIMYHVPANMDLSKSTEGLLFEPLMALIPVILSMVTRRTFFQIFQAGIVLGDRLRANARQYLLVLAFGIQTISFRQARPGASVLNEPGVAVSRAHLRC